MSPMPKSNHQGRGALLCASVVLLLAACSGEPASTPPAPTLVLPETVEVGEEPTPTATSPPSAVSPTSRPITTTPEPEFRSPPPATLTVEGAEQTSGVGTYCWTTEGMGGICADYIGVPTPAEPLRVTSPMLAVLELQVEDRPDSLSLAVFAVSAGMDQLPDNPDLSSWPFPQEFESRRDLELASSTPFELSLEPGLYVVSVFAAWDDLGDVNYGFLIDVR